MKKNKSIKNNHHGYKLFGLVSQLKEYRLAYLINNVLKIAFEKRFIGEDSACFYYFYSDSYYEYYLIPSNEKSSDIIKKFKNINSLLLLKPHIPVNKPDTIATTLMEKPDISACVRLPVDSLEELSVILETDFN